MNFNNDTIGQQIDKLLDELTKSSKGVPSGRFDQLETTIRELQYKIKKVEEIMLRVDENFVGWSENHTKVHNNMLNEKIVSLEARIVKLEKEKNMRESLTTPFGVNR